MIENISDKVCKKCLQQKSISKFYKSKINPDGYYNDCIDCRHRIYLRNKEKLVKYNKDRYEKNKQAKLIQIKKWRDDNKEKTKIYSKKWRNKNRKYYCEYVKNRSAIDPLFKLRNILKRGVLKSFSKKGYKKESSTYKLLGADYDIVKQHIQRQFKKGMAWSNHGEWHIDHKIPLASANTKDELLILFHYRNLQPLWAIDNMSKNDTIIETQTYLTI